MSLSILYITHKDIPKLGQFCREAIAAGSGDLQVVAVTPYATMFENSYKRELEPDPHLDLYMRILQGIDAAKHDRVAIVEHDTLYPAGYFREAAAIKMTQPFMYNTALMRMNSDNFFFHPNRGRYTIGTANLIADKDTLRDEVQERIDLIGRGVKIAWAEPGRYWHSYQGGRGYSMWQCTAPTVDVRYGGNLTGHRMAKPDAYTTMNLPPWGDHAELKGKLGME